MSKVRISLVLSVTLVTLICALLLTPSRADGGANHQKRNMHFGVSGGNINMTRAGVLGVGAGASDKNNAEAAVVIYVDKTAGARPQLPGKLEGCACGSS